VDSRPTPVIARFTQCFNLTGKPVARLGDPLANPHSKAQKTPTPFPRGHLARWLFHRCY